MRFGRVSGRSGEPPPAPLPVPLVAQIFHARRAIGWNGRRAAVLSTVGFAIVLLNFIPVGYFLTRSHNF